MALILDGGATEISAGAAADLSEAVPAILRPGMVLRSQIEAVLRPIRVGRAGADRRASSASLRAPHAAGAQVARRDREAERGAAWR